MNKEVFILCPVKAYLSEDGDIVKVDSPNVVLATDMYHALGSYSTLEDASTSMCENMPLAPLFVKESSKELFHNLKPGSVFQMPNPLNKGIMVTFLRTNVGVINMDTWSHVDASKVRNWISNDTITEFVGNLNVSDLERIFG